MICTRCKKQTSHGRHMNEGLVCSDCVNRQKFEEGQEGFFLCRICGESDSPANWLGDNALEEGLCFSCSFWIRHLESYRRDNKLVIRGHMYHVGKEAEEKGEFRGFGGREFTVRMLSTDKTFISTNLWHNGKVPKRFRSYLPDNAEFLPQGR